MIPISDENPTRLTPFVSWALIAACVAVFFWELTFDERDSQALIFSLGFIPKNFFEQSAAHAVYPIPAWLTIFTSMFMHGGFLHVGGNMLYLWVFGNNVEDAMGHARFLFFYLICGVAAALSEGLVSPEFGRADVRGVGGNLRRSGLICSGLSADPHHSDHSAGNSSLSDENFGVLCGRILVSAAGAERIHHGAGRAGHRVDGACWRVCDGIGADACALAISSVRPLPPRAVGLERYGNPSCLLWTFCNGSRFWRTRKS